MKNDFIDPDNARVDEQKNVMAEILTAGHCPFCEENLRKYHQLPIIKEGDFWVITPNQWPYEHTQYHWLAIHRSHVETLQELTPEAGAELVVLLGEMERDYNLVGGGVGLRFGDSDYNAGTVSHLHAQLIIPDIDAPDFQPVRLKIGKEKEKRQPLP